VLDVIVLQYIYIDYIYWILFYFYLYLFFCHCFCTTRRSVMTSWRSSCGRDDQQINLEDKQGEWVWNTLSFTLKTR